MHSVHAATAKTLASPAAVLMKIIVFPARTLPYLILTSSAQQIVLEAQVLPSISSSIPQRCANYVMTHVRPAPESLKQTA